ncbi:MAG TPA: hypothetical protein VK892_10350 [Pyrinomonadaceae bacterium]|nr:hypothetical protein [Pyrinomonadaceae bacterium]
MGRKCTKTEGFSRICGKINLFLFAFAKANWMIDSFILISAEAACLLAKLSTRLLLVAIYKALLLVHYPNKKGTMLESFPFI